jgi:hypothetical protein
VTKSFTVVVLVSSGAKDTNLFLFILLKCERFSTIIKFVGKKI